MKLLIKFFITIFVLSSAFFSLAESKKIIVATDTAFVPFEFKKGNRYIGFDIDLWNAITKELKLDYVLRPMDFNGIIPALQTKNIDVALAGMTITKERKKVIDFSNSYYKSGLLVIIRNDEKNIKNINDLNNKIVSVKLGSSSAYYAKRHIKTKNLHQLPNINETYMELATHRTDAVLNDAPNILYFMRTSGKGHFKIVGDLIEAQEYGIAFPKNSDELRKKVNDALDILHKNGTYDKIYKKWFLDN